MAKFIEVNISNSMEVESVLINIDQIVSVEKYKTSSYCICTTAIHPVAQGTKSICYIIQDREFERIRPLLTE